jgi:dienelactone hydrolase
MRSRVRLPYLLMLLVGMIGLTALPMKMRAEAQTARIQIYPLQTVTLTEEQFLTGVKEGRPATIAGELRLPRGQAERLPAVVLVHGSAGVGSNVDRWAQEFNGIGVAAFLLDSFTGRGITNTAADQSQLAHVAMIVDAYRALELLSRHPRIDPTRIAVTGFSKGGFVALYASLKRFQRLQGPAGVEFAAYLPFYAPCARTYIDDEQVADRPIRLFHGAADDWVPVQPCQRYVERLRGAGKDVQLTVYPGAHHAFDVSLLPQSLYLPQAQRGPGCFLVERVPGQVVNRDTGRPFAYDDPCVERGATVGYNPQAHAETIKAVKAFLASTFKLNPQ